MKKGLHQAVLQSRWALETLRVQAEERLMTNSSIVTEMSLDSFKDIINADSEEEAEKFQEIRNLQKRIQSTLLFKKSINVQK